MPHIFADDIRTAILRHMNDDHRDDNVLITRAFVDPDISDAEMIDVDGDSGYWLVSIDTAKPFEVRIPWPAGPINDRPAIRREVVALYDEACARLGVRPRAHS